MSVRTINATLKVLGEKSVVFMTFMHCVNHMYAISSNLQTISIKYLDNGKQAVYKFPHLLFRRELMYIYDSLHYEEGNASRGLRETVTECILVWIKAVHIQKMKNKKQSSDAFTILVS